MTPPPEGRTPIIATEKLGVLLNTALGQKPSDAWECVRAFFAAHAEELPEKLREEYVLLQTALFRDSADGSAKPLTAEEKLQRLRSALWRLKGRH